METANNMIIPTNNIEGNITSCRIEQALKSIDKKSVFSLTQTNTYMTYDVCNRQVISEYKLQSLGSFSWFFVVLISLFVLGLGIGKSSSEQRF